MSDPTPRPRRWFQIHLSTAVVMMVVAGGLLGLNLYAAQMPQTPFESGLPLCDWSRDSAYIGQLALHVPGILVINGVLNLAFLLLIGLLLERFIRRREARKP